MEISGVLAVLAQALVVNYFGKSVIVGKAAERSALALYHASQTGELVA